MAELTDQEMNEYMDDYEEVSIKEGQRGVTNDGVETNSHSYFPSRLSFLRGPEMFVYHTLWL